MKTYAFITILFFYFSVSSCTTNEIGENNNQTQQVSTTPINGVDLDGNPVKTNDRD